jgi:proline iminopeptidase
VTERVLRGIFLGRRSELAWFYQNPQGTASLYPDRWEAYLAPIPKGERRNMLQAYYRSLTSVKRKTVKHAARGWSIWEGATSYLRTNPKEIAASGGTKIASALARIGCHYLIHRCFLRRDSQLLDDVHRIRRIRVSPRTWSELHAGLQLQPFSCARKSVSGFAANGFTLAI